MGPDWTLNQLKILKANKVKSTALLIIWNFPVIISIYDEKWDIHLTVRVISSYWLRPIRAFKIRCLTAGIKSSKKYIRKTFKTLRVNYSLSETTKKCHHFWLPLHQSGILIYNVQVSASIKVNWIAMDLKCNNYCLYYGIQKGREKNSMASGGLKNQAWLKYMYMYVSTDPIR